ncbi:MAG: lytic transglycosylase domain-containing protein [Pseudomonadota bacterium]
MTTHIRRFWILLIAIGSVASEAAQQALPDAEFRRLLKEAITESSSFRDRFEAEVWLVDMSSRLERLVPHIPKHERISILRNVHTQATRFKLNPQLVLSLIQVESAFDRFAVSSAGARGLMQVMPFWKKEIGQPEDNLLKIDTNIQYGCAILSLYIKREKNRLSEALARYNGSVGKTWYPERVFKAWDKWWFVKNY